ncbi:MAG: transporter [Rhodobacterales bacterium]|nr:MAG: transporter [Rhodobacterales bacterium]
MLSFFLTLGRMLKAIYRSWQDPAFRSTLILAALIGLSGTAFYHAVEGWSWVDAAYFSTMVATTVGLGDFAPTTPLSKVFTIIYAVTSIGVFVALVSQIAAALIAPGDQKNKS